jgi:diguanylate cyclase (GGDEF)-like protein
MLDNSTLLTIGATLCAAAAGVQALVATRFGCRALWWWSAGNVVVVFGCASPMMLDVLPPAAFALLTSLVVVLAPSMVVAGLRDLAGLPFSPLEVFGGPLIATALVGVSLVYGDDYAQRVLIVAAGLDYYFLRAAYRLLNGDRGHLRTIRAVCATIAVIVAAVYSVRCIDIALNGIRVLDLRQDTSGTFARAVALIAISIWNAISLLLPADRLMAIDDLTRLLNRRAFMVRGDFEAHAAAKDRRPLSLLMIDLDHFKSINDRFGHHMGDVVLANFGRVIAAQIPTELVGRLGGEEFCVLLPDCNGPGAQAVAERLRASCERQLRLSLDDGVLVTVSIGLATSDRGDIDLCTLMSAADRALYEAKTAGRNRVATTRRAA